MGGDPGTGEEDLYCGLGEMHIHLLLDVLIRHGIIHALHVDMVVILVEYGSNTDRRNCEPIIRTEYIHNTHYENPPQNNITLYIDDLFLDIHRILWYIRIVVEFCMISSSEA